MTELPALFEHKTGKFIDVADESALDEMHRAALAEIRIAVANDQAIGDKLADAQTNVKNITDQITELERVQRTLPQPSFLDDWRNMKQQRAIDHGRA
jgi:hypothetical protein